MIKNMNRLLTIFGILLVGLISPKAIACACMGGSTVEEGFKGADIVASGQVISSTTVWIPDFVRIKEMTKLGIPVDSLDKRLNGYYLKKVQILIDTLYKGKVANDTLTIYTGMGAGDCGYSFKEGQKYIVYGDSDSYFGDLIKDQELKSDQDIYWTNICTRTQQHNKKEAKALEKIKI